MPKSTLWLSRIVEYILLEIMIISVSYNVFPAFRISHDLVSNYMIVILCSAIPLLLLNITFSFKEYNLIFIFVWIGITAAGIIFAINAGLLSTSSFEFENNYSIYVIILLVDALAFIASRFRAVLFALFAATIIIFASLTVLAYKTNWIFLVTFLISMAAFCSFNFYHGSIKISHVKKAMPLRYLLTIFVFCFICIAASFGVYNIVQAANPPVRKATILSNPTFLKFAERYGVATYVIGPPQPMKQPQQSLKQETPKNKTQNPAQNPSGGSGSNKSNSKSPASNSASSLSQRTPPKKKPPKVQPVTYLRKWPVVLIIVISVAVAFLLIFLMKKLFRSMWYKKMLKGDKKYQIVQLYSKILRILSVFGYKRIASDTPLEFAEKLRSSKEGITFEESDFRQITDIFTKVNYGGKSVSDKDYNTLIAFYNNILYYCRHDTGFFKFIFKYLFV